MTGAASAVNSDLFGDAVKFASGGMGIGGGVYTFRWFLNWLTGRHDRREGLIDAKDKELDDRWAKYTKKIEDRCEEWEGRCRGLEAEVEDCHRSKRDLETRVSRLEGFDKGLGERRQEDQRSASYDSQIARSLGNSPKPKV